MYLDEFDDQHIQNLHDAKQIIFQYQLWKCQLVFTVVELQNNNLLIVPFCHTSVESRIMTDETAVTPSKFSFVHIYLKIISSY